jgi:hypothetical protein
VFPAFPVFSQSPRESSPTGARIERAQVTLSLFDMAEVLALVVAVLQVVAAVLKLVEVFARSGLF